MKAVINCNMATQEFLFRTVILLAPLGRTLAQQKTVVPDKNVPGRKIGFRDQWLQKRSSSTSSAPYKWQNANIFILKRVYVLIGI